MSNEMTWRSDGEREKKDIFGKLEGRGGCV